MNSPRSRPTVSVVLPTLNERRYIRDCLDSLAAQDEVALAEILVVDGGSTDGTRDIVSAFGAPVTLVDNPGMTAAAAMNIGMKRAVGAVIVRADAHTLYAPDYVRRCSDLLQESGADNVGGPMRPVGATSFGRAVAAVTTSRLGIGPGRFHLPSSAGEVDTVYLGSWRRETLLDLGGFDETHLQWGAEDHELNFRIRQRGGRVLLDPTILSWYFPRESARALCRQYFNYGLGKASTLVKHGALPSWRPLAPAALVAAQTVAAFTARRWRWRWAIATVHLFSCASLALRVGRDPGVAPHRALVATLICHWSYGIGFWIGIYRWASGRGSDSRPKRHR